MLDSKLTFENYPKVVPTKINKNIGLLCKLQILFPRTVLIINNKAFVRLHFDFGDSLYDQAFNFSFHHKLESIYYKVVFAITGVIQGTNKGKIYQEVSLESLQSRR